VCIRNSSIVISHSGGRLTLGYAILYSLLAAIYAQAGKLTGKPG
jgi:hypothetical protein